MSPVTIANYGKIQINKQEPRIQRVPFSVSRWRHGCRLVTQHNRDVVSE
ncbi:hypothetical protein [Acinetobacter seifertii]|nr:hypothetical protein [Acinetobacter seifertii]MBZ6533771.1 hypothetical protein [Acinetobacter seifertii]